MKLRTLLPYVLVLSVSAISLAQVKAPPVPPLSDEVQCKIKLKDLATSAPVVHAVIVTNDSQTQYATYLIGDLRNGTSNVTGTLDEYQSKNLLGCTNCNGKLQPFSARATQSATLAIAHNGNMSITWPGSGGTTSPTPICMPNGTFVFQESQYAGVLTLSAKQNSPN